MSNSLAETAGAGIGGCLFIILLVGAILGIEGWVIMSLWNWLVPVFASKTSLPQEITFWPALGLGIVLSWIGSLFKSKSNKG